jgi:hypothetical protein
MKKAVMYLRRTLRVTLWVTLGFVFLFLLLLLLLQIPAVQNRIVRNVTSLISSKTDTRVEVSYISISFPKSIILEGLYLEDIEKDTLVYAGRISANIALFNLLSNRISIRSIAIENATINLYSSRIDSLFNYNFLMNAFADTTTQIAADTPKAMKWIFSLDKVSLHNVRFTYNDEYYGLKVHADVERLKGNVNTIAPGEALYAFDKLSIEGLSVLVLERASSNSRVSSVKNNLPSIKARELRVANSTVTYTDSVSHLSVVSVIDRLTLKDALVDVQNELLDGRYLSVKNSNIRYRSTRPESIGEALFPDTNLSSVNNWKISIQQVDLADNSFLYRIGYKPALKNEFDPNHIQFHHLTLKGTDFYYDADLVKILVAKCSAIDQNNFVISSLRTDFAMDQHSIAAKNTRMKTPTASIDADFQIQYASLETFIETLQFKHLYLDMRHVSFQGKDILYFNRDLLEEPFFRHRTNTTILAGKLTGPMHQLTGKDLEVRTGASTIIKTNFVIAGLPDYRNSHYRFPDLRITTSRSDIRWVAGHSVPPNIELPEKISLRIAFSGSMNAFASTILMNSSFGSAQLNANVDEYENFNGKAEVFSFDLGRLLRDTILYGPVSLTADTRGKGLLINSVNAGIRAQVSSLYLNRYTYHALSLDGRITGKAFEGKINLNDENAAFDFDGYVNLNPDQERFRFHLDVLGADLQKLHFTKEDIRIGFSADADIKGSAVGSLNGTAGISKLIVARDDDIYVLDSVLFASLNESKRSELNFRSALITLAYSGNISPVNIVAELAHFVNNYFPFSDSLQTERIYQPSNFSFDIQLHNHPILAEVIFPQLEEFEGGVIRGNFNSATSELKLHAAMHKIVYGSTEINGFLMDVDSDPAGLKYTISSTAVSNTQMKLANLLIKGKLADNTLFSAISSIGDDQRKKIMFSSRITKENARYRFVPDQEDFWLMYKRWTFAEDSYVEFGKEGMLIHNFFIHNDVSQINVFSVNDHFNDDISIEIKNFKLDDLSRIVEKDTGLVKGVVDGNLLLKRMDNHYGIIADAAVSNLVIRDVAVGDVTVKADNAVPGRSDIDAALTGAGNNMTATGYYVPGDGGGTFNINTDIQSLSMKTVEAFSGEQISEASGALSGNIKVSGAVSRPDIAGELIFNDVFVNPVFLNNRLHLKHETLFFSAGQIKFSGFTLLDVDQNSAVIDGVVKMHDFKDFLFDLQVHTTDFLVFNTTAADNSAFFGRMVIDSRIDIAGPITLPVVNARVKVKEGSNFTFVVPEDKLTIDRGSGVVEFEDSMKLNPILYREKEALVQNSGMRGYDLSSVIEVDREATLRLLMDPSSSDSLVVKGEAALSFSIDRSGKMSLTGAYHLDDGSYLVSLRSVVKRKFDILSGSTIIWDGDPLGAKISINAKHTVRTSPYDLVAGQMSGLSESESAGYKQRYPFWVMLKLRGEILHPSISFEIQLPPEEKDVLGGALNQKLTMLNEDESALNKQVFALLVLGRFVQENPFQSEWGGTSAIVRTTVGKFLSSQLNQLTSRVIHGVEVDFDIQSYDDYQTGEAMGRTEVGIGIRKELFKDRLSVQLGGTLDIEGEQAKQNSASDITSDIQIEYKLTKDGHYRLKGFRHNQYEGAIEGQLVETGLGVVFVRDFNQWRHLFRKQKIKIESPEK